MFVHVVLFRWKPGTTAEQVAPVAPALQALAATLPVLSYECGPNLGLAAADIAYDFGVAARFESKAGWDEYMADEEHDRIRQELIFPIADQRATIQFEA
jgi:hypothetical protein